ncbi:unnamed protein product, partial [Larinioides sclopetarius]
TLCRTLAKKTFKNTQHKISNSNRRPSGRLKVKMSLVKTSTREN